MDSRTCSRCGQIFPLTREHFGQTPSGGFRSYCRKCKNEGTAEWARRNPDKTRAKWERQNENRITAGVADYGYEEIALLRTLLKGRCAYCNIPLENGSEIDHVLPISRGGTDTIDNVTLSCRKCNREKGDRTRAEYWDWRLNKALNVRRVFGRTLSEYKSKQFFTP